MKTIIAGSRNIKDYNLVLDSIKESNFIISEVVCGMASGPDSLGERYALENNIPVIYFPANWKLYNKAAGTIRNEKMGDYAEALIAIWDGKSSGTKHMISYAKKLNLKIYIKTLNSSNDISRFIL